MSSSLVRAVVTAAREITSEKNTGAVVKATKEANAAGNKAAEQLSQDNVTNTREARTVITDTTIALGQMRTNEAADVVLERDQQQRQRKAVELHGGAATASSAKPGSSG